MKAISYHPLVQKDINLAMEYYFLEASEEVAHEFWHELSACLLKVRKNPARFHFDATGMRRCNLKKFPFHVLFVDYPDRVKIQVVRHHSRRSSFGTRRKRD